MIEADSHFIVRSRLARRNEQIRSRNWKFSIGSRPKVRSKHPVPLSHVGKFLARCFRCQRTLMLMLCVTNNNSPSTHASFLSATKQHDLPTPTGHMSASTALNCDSIRADDFLLDGFSCEACAVQLLRDDHVISLCKSAMTLSAATCVHFTCAIYSKCKLLLRVRHIAACKST